MEQAAKKKQKVANVPPMQPIAPATKKQQPVEQEDVHMADAKAAQPPRQAPLPHVAQKAPATSAAPVSLPQI